MSFHITISITVVIAAYNTYRTAFSFHRCLYTMYNIHDTKRQKIIAKVRAQYTVWNFFGKSDALTRRKRVFMEK